MAGIFAAWLLCAGVGFGDASAEPTRHAKARPLAPGAVVADWPDFLGPGRRAEIVESPLAATWPEGGPRLIWSVTKGTGYAGCSVAAGRLVLFHRMDDEERIACRDAETGTLLWREGYPSRYRDRFGYANGPRATPVIDGAHLYTLGAEGQLDCRLLATGTPVWRMNIVQRFGLRQGFFGVGATPLIEGDLLVLNVGAPEVKGGTCVVALHKRTGEIVWRTGDRWGASYASPVAGTVHGKRTLFVLAGGASRPPVGGLLCIDPADGRIAFRFPWRSRAYESVSAANPVIYGHRVLVSASYGTGTASLSIDEHLRPTSRWTTTDLGAHWATPIHHDGHLYGIDGRHSEEAAIVCINGETGATVWRFAPRWTQRYVAHGREQAQSYGIGRGTLLRAGDRFLCLGEHGHLLWLSLTPICGEVLVRGWLFAASDTWTPPTLSRGLLYVMQHHRDAIHGTPPRLLCYDLRGGRRDASRVTHDESPSGILTPGP